MDCFNKIIKTRLLANLFDRGTVLWVDVIQKLVDAYNDSRHRSIVMAPSDVQKTDKNSLCVRLYGNGDIHIKSPIPQWAMVQASKQNKFI